MKSTDTASAHPRKWWVLASVGAGTFMSALDGSIVNTILPVIRNAFTSDVASVEWVVTVYLLVVSGLLLGFGRLGDIYGHKRVYLWGFVVFVTGSALCGFSGSVWHLVGFRAVQAFGAALLFSNAPAVLTMNFPASERGRALGLQATMTYLGLTAGPTLGGWLSAHWTWRAVFYINVPVGLLALYLGTRMIPNGKGSESRERFDIAGASVFFAALVALLLGLNQGHAWGWGSAATIGLLSGAALLFAAFVRVETVSGAPMLDLGLFRNAGFSAAAASAVMNYTSAFILTFVLPFYLLQGRGLSPDRAGLVLSAQPLVMAMTAPLSGLLSDRIGPRAPATAGMLLLAAAMALLAGVDGATPIVRVALCLGLVGFGSGLFTAPNNSALMGAAPKGRQGIAAGVMALARNVGMSLGVGLAGAIMTTVMAHGPGADSLFRAVSACALTAAAIAAAGAVTSYVRER